MSAPFEEVPQPPAPLEGELSPVHLPPWDREAVELGVHLRTSEEEEEEGMWDDSLWEGQ